MILESTPVAAGKSSQPFESRSELSKRYLRELAELIDDRQITAAFAQQVIHDLFEPEQPGSSRRVRLAVWQSYLQDHKGHIGPRFTAATKRIEGDHS